MCWHKADGRVVAVGTRQDAFMLETWEHVDGAWQQRFPATPVPERQGFELVYDEARRVVVLYGGNFVYGTYTNETWEWDGVDWTLRTPAMSPPPRQAGSMAYDVQRGVSVMYGGNGATGILDELWEWDGTIWSLQPNPTINPGRRSAALMTYDSARNVLVMFGGNTPVAQNDVWEFDGTQWSQFVPSFRPPRLQRATMTFDTDTNRTTLYGGMTAGTGTMNTDVWQWDGSVWTRSVTPVTPGDRQLPGLAYDSKAQQLVLHGGQYDTDTWTYDVANNAWQREGYDAPRISSWATQCFDGGHHTIYNSLLGTLLWDHDTQTWEKVPLTLEPPYASRGPMTFDLVRQEAIMLSWQGTQSETWVFDRINRQWHLRAPANNVTPSNDPAMAYNPSTNRTVVFTGSTTSSWPSQTWEWDGTDWTQLFPATQPPSRQGSMAAFDWQTGKVVMFGGSSGTTILNDVWEWDGTDWSQRTITGASPSPRQLASMGGRTSGLLLAGGDDGLQGFGDLWELRGNQWFELASEGIPLATRAQGTVDYLRGEMTLFAGMVSLTQQSTLGPFFCGGQWVWGVPRASKIAIGTGCPGSGGVPELTANTTPEIGQSIVLTTSNAATGQPTAFLFGSKAERVDMAGSCRLLVPEAFAFPMVTTQPNGDASLTVPVPAIPAFAGLQIWTQAIAFDQAAPGYALSNALRLSLGSL